MQGLKVLHKKVCNLISCFSQYAQKIDYKKFTKNSQSKNRVEGDGHNSKRKWIWKHSLLRQNREKTQKTLGGSYYNGLEKRETTAKISWLLSNTDRSVNGVG